MSDLWRLSPSVRDVWLWRDRCGRVVRCTSSVRQTRVVIPPVVSSPYNTVFTLYHFLTVFDSVFFNPHQHCRLYCNVLCYLNMGGEGGGCCGKRGGEGMWQRSTRRQGACGVVVVVISVCARCAVSCERSTWAFALLNLYIETGCLVWNYFAINLWLL